VENFDEKSSFIKALETLPDLQAVDQAV